MKKTMKENIQSTAVKAALSYLDSNPEENMPKLINVVDKLDVCRNFDKQIRAVRDNLSDKSGNWQALINSLYTDIDAGLRKKIFENFVINSAVLGMERQKLVKGINGCNVPWAILLDPTSACNLSCKGCWAAEYEKNLNLTIESWNSIIWQGKGHGTFVYLYSGGEPLVRKKDIIKMCEEHTDCVFAAFTNGTLIDEEFADEVLRVKNFVPIISIEGFEAETDFRRGEGVYAATIKAMEILKRKKLLFGVSCCYTSKNAEVIGSEAYIDDIILKGAKFAWFFTYMPVGVHADPELIATASQREFMYCRIREFRRTKPLFTMDFWNDGEYVKGCIAGGRCYLHINANGDIEPCAFIHYSDSNIKEKSLLEAYKSPLFMQYHDNQPFNENHLRPCPLLDNPGRLTEMVKKSGAYSTDLQNPEDVTELSAKCVHAAENWSVVADELWQSSQGLPNERGCIMNILVTLNSNYIKPLKIMLKSLFLNNPGEKFQIYLLHTSLKNDELDDLTFYIERHGSKLSVIHVDENCFNDAPVIFHYTKEMYFRLLAYQLLPRNLDRILYLDPDILVLNPVRELYETDIRGYLYAAAYHDIGSINEINKIRLYPYEINAYYNSGVLLMNLEQLRVDVNEKEIFQFVEENRVKLVMPDQDILNALYSTEIKNLNELYYNYDARYYTYYKLKNNGDFDMDQIINKTVILHFCGKKKPWTKKYTGTFYSLYKHYEKQAR